VEKFEGLHVDNGYRTFLFDGFLYFMTCDEIVLLARPNARAMPAMKTSLLLTINQWVRSLPESLGSALYRAFCSAAEGPE
jgi:hypothetical protein